MVLFIALKASLDSHALGSLWFYPCAVFVGLLKYQTCWNAACFINNDRASFWLLRQDDGFDERPAYSGPRATIIVTSVTMLIVSGLLLFTSFAPANIGKHPGIWL
jgi:hypothetical protein